MNLSILYSKQGIAAIAAIVALVALVFGAGDVVCPVAEAIAGDIALCDAPVVEVAPVQ